MPPEKNPFLKPSTKPANKDTAGFIESVLGKKEGDAARKVIGKHQQKTKPALEFTSIQLSPEEKARAEEYEKNRPWTREEVIEWAKDFGVDENGEVEGWVAEEWVDENFIFHADRSITVERNLILEHKPVTKLPRGIKSIGGALILDGANITSLEDLPRTIGDSLSLENCSELTSLKGLESVSVGGHLVLRNTKITSLEGLPRAIGSGLVLEFMPITSLKGLESVSIGGQLILSNTQITSLEGLPRAIGSDLYLDFVPITSLKGLESVSIGGSLILDNSKITSLEGLPKEIEGYLGLANTPITSLKGISQVIVHGLNISNTQINSLKDLPLKIGGGLYLRGIPATEIPPGVEAKKIYVDANQTELIESLRKNGYGDKIEII